jgi:hypothetical protein
MEGEKILHEDYEVGLGKCRITAHSHEGLGAGKGNW